MDMDTGSVPRRASRVHPTSSDNVASIQRHIHLLLTFLKDYKCLTDAYLSNVKEMQDLHLLQANGHKTRLGTVQDYFLLEHSQNVQSSWWDTLKCMELIELASFLKPDHWESRRVWPLSLLAFRSSIHALPLRREPVDASSDIARFSKEVSTLDRDSKVHSEVHTQDMLQSVDIPTAHCDVGTQEKLQSIDIPKSHCDEGTEGKYKGGDMLNIHHETGTQDKRQHVDITHVQISVCPQEKHQSIDVPNVHHDVYTQGKHQNGDVQNEIGTQDKHQTVDITNVQHSIGSQDGQYLLLEHCYRRHVKPKKQHEILVLAKAVQQMSVQTGCRHVVDVGAGQGHLSRLLSFGYGLRVTTIEAASCHVPKASKFDGEVRRDIMRGQCISRKKQKRLQREAGPEYSAMTVRDGPAPSHVVAWINADISVGDFLTRVRTAQDDLSGDLSKNDDHRPSHNGQAGDQSMNNHYCPSHNNQAGDQSMNNHPCPSYNNQAGNPSMNDCHRPHHDKAGHSSMNDHQVPSHNNQAGEPSTNDHHCPSHNDQAGDQSMNNDHCPSHNGQAGDQSMNIDHCPSYSGQAVDQSMNNDHCPSHYGQAGDQSMNIDHCPSYNDQAGDQSMNIDHCPSHNGQAGDQSMNIDHCPSHNDQAGDQSVNIDHCPSHNDQAGDRSVNIDHCPSYSGQAGDRSMNIDHCPSHNGQARARADGVNTSEAPPFVLTGLHACGDLTPTMLRVFVACSQARALASVGCCYMKMDMHELDRGDRELGYPMSEFVNSLDDHTLSWEAREMACHFTDAYYGRLTDADQDPNGQAMAHLRTHCYRAALQEVIAEKDDSIKHGSIKLTLKKAHRLPFNEYAEKALRRLGLDPSLSHEHMQRAAGRLEQWREVVAFYVLRLSLAPLLESLILLDRMLYLAEKGIQCTVLPVFDPDVSPRNFLLLAAK